MEWGRGGGRATGEKKYIYKYLFLFWCTIFCHCCCSRSLFRLSLRWKLKWFVFPFLVVFFCVTCYAHTRTHSRPESIASLHCAMRAYHLLAFCDVILQHINYSEYLIKWLRSIGSFVRACVCVCACVCRTRHSQSLSPNKRCARQIQFKFHNNSLIIINYELSAAAATDEKTRRTRGTQKVVLLMAVTSRITLFPFTTHFLRNSSHSVLCVFVCVFFFFCTIKSIDMKLTAF